MRHTFALLPLLLPSVVLAQVSGVPEPPSPTPLPTFWIGMSNDTFGDAIRNDDDFRTAGVRGGGRLGRWVVEVDGSILTNRGRDGSAPGRVDELSYTLGYALYDDEREQERSEQRWRSLIIIGGGARTVTRLGGEAIQNGLHSLASFPLVYLPYDRERATDALAYVYARSLWLVAANAKPELAPAGDFGVQGEASALTTTGGQQQGFLGAKAVLLGRQGAAWIGGRWEWHRGNAPSPTANHVLDHETGPWLLAGVQAGPLGDSNVGVYLQGALNPRGNAVDGTLGLIIAPQPGRSGGEPVRFDQTLLYFPDGGAIGLQVRWRPRWFFEHGLSQRDTLFLDYHFGWAPGYDDFTGDVVDANQVLAGFQPTWTWHPFSAFLTEGWVAAGAGYRVEQVRPYGDKTPRFAASAKAYRPVVQGGAGVRLGWDDGTGVDHLWERLRLGIGYSAYVPFWRATVGTGADQAEFMKPGGGVELSLGAHLAW